MYRKGVFRYVSQSLDIRVIDRYKKSAKYVRKASSNTNQPHLKRKLILSCLLRRTEDIGNLKKH